MIQTNLLKWPQELTKEHLRGPSGGFPTCVSVIAGHGCTQRVLLYAQWIFEGPIREFTEDFTLLEKVILPLGDESEQIKKISNTEIYIIMDYNVDPTTYYRIDANHWPSTLTH